MNRARIRHHKSASRRREIIQAALACFTESGFTETPMAEIRRRSHASTGSIYHHFRSKEHLAAEIYLEGIQDYQEGFVGALEEQTGSREGIFAVISYHLRWIEAHPDWTKYLFRMRHAEFMSEANEEFAQLNKTFFERCARWFARQVKGGAVRRLPPDLYASLLMGPCMELTRQYLSGHVCTPLTEAIPVLADAAWRALGAEWKST
jgi:AcrR family transcriptional regulator